MSDVFICTTDFSPEVKKYLKQLIILIGAKVSDSIELGKTTHLICNHPSGPKFEVFKKNDNKLKRDT